MAKRRNLKKEKQERNRAYARKFKKRKLRGEVRSEGLTLQELLIMVGLQINSLDCTKFR